eukprot:CAMPEP_0184653282 /NCGR_PEP_ID=MMETSP0308-20130426/11003_1 /TAXON_ID=38269 /ORGANISM="Gloeochaete witrockiana, Strain SAG 46.84" /LENGTH=493 /DNA_ID=CAMNT_0027088649 /DNA_START=228 /DNA_END=1709 /DNA_ORIENTATION=-
MKRDARGHPPISLRDSGVALEDFFLQLAPTQSSSYSSVQRNITTPLPFAKVHHDDWTSSSPLQRPPRVHLYSPSGEKSTHNVQQQRQEFIHTISSISDQWRSYSRSVSLSDVIERAAKDPNFLSLSTEFSDPNVSVGKLLGLGAGAGGLSTGSCTTIGPVSGEGAQRLLRTFSNLNEQAQHLFDCDVTSDNFLHNLEQDILNSHPLPQAAMVGANGHGPDACSSSSSMDHSEVQEKIRLFRTISQLHNLPAVQKQLLDEPGGGGGYSDEGLYSRSNNPDAAPFLPRTRSQKARAARYQRKLKRSQGHLRGTADVSRDSESTCEELMDDTNKTQSSNSRKVPKVEAGAPECNRNSISSSSRQVHSPGDSENAGGGGGGGGGGASSPSQSKVESDPEQEKKRKKWASLLRNRESAARDRQRKKQYLKDLEIKAKGLEEENTRLRARVQELEACMLDGGKPLSRQNSKGLGRTSSGHGKALRRANSMRLSVKIPPH